MLVGDAKVRARASRVQKLLRIVCGGEEFPHFVSDEATVYDVCSLPESELAAKLTRSYGVAVEAAHLREPIWELVDRLDPNS